MIGDRIDNDIEPANKLGMKTIWVKQGFSVYQIPMNDFQQADYVVDTVYIRTKEYLVITIKSSFIFPTSLF